MSEQRWDFINAAFVKSAVEASHYPPGDLAEVAFIGRSNVGKSSLINSLCRNGRLAKTSGTPGKTRTINFFSVQVKFTDDQLPRKGFFLVDLPGYGFARAPRTEKSAWAEFIRLYVTSSRRLKLICQLIDIRHDLMENDAQCYKWLITTGLPVYVVFTKADKLSAKAASVQSALLRRSLALPEGSSFVYSALKNTGRAELITGITEHI